MGQPLFTGQSKAIFLGNLMQFLVIKLQGNSSAQALPRTPRLGSPSGCLRSCPLHQCFGDPLPGPTTHWLTRLPSITSSLVARAWHGAQRAQHKCSRQDWTPDVENAQGLLWGTQGIYSVARLPLLHSGRAGAGFWLHAHLPPPGFSAAKAQISYNLIKQVHYAGQRALALP